MRKITDPESHFWTRVNVASGNLCWEWKGPLTEYGYGRTKLSHLKTQIASRIAWILTSGVVPPKTAFVCHKCDNPKCCRPDHLFLGTAADNSQDREDKGRGRDVKGVSHHHAKLSDGDILEIRSLRKSGMYLKDIGKRFGVTLQMVWYITSGKNWSHVKADPNAAR